MARRNFNMLFDEEEENTGAVLQGVERNISRKIESARLTGDVVSLFLPKIFSTVVHFFGGSQSDNSADSKSDYEDPASSSGSFGPPR